MSDKRVIGVVVTYEPDPQSLQRLLAAALPQVAALVLVHNGNEAPSVTLPAGAEVQILTLGDNLGIARAQNEGIGWARGRAATHVLLFDQDSVPAPDMLERLLHAEEQLAGSGVPVAALGPRYLDPRQDNPPPFLQVRGLRLHRQPCSTPADIVPVDYLVSSGCLIPLTALERVGGMNERLFIDYVDIEWGLRAARAGLQSYGVCGAQMRHALGDEPLMVLGQARPVRSPLRHYYLFRNAVWLYRQAEIRGSWKCVDGWRLLLKFAAYGLFAKPRAMHLRMMTMGVWDGLRGRLGRYRGDA
ncbi:MAG: glycosyltransferase family 2 protein [Chromatiaceae bacterium]|nr:glycosyltransferase family 2 protein [Chromatiaceae bacterium]MCP5315387.1 glycosyltransferase family 2 protein [Chromatiaceae bacterium]